MKKRLAILDMNNGFQNKGIPSLKSIAQRFSGLEVEVFDVRKKNQIPNLDFDIYLFSGGPGAPFKLNQSWEERFYSLLDDLWSFNLETKSPNKKKFCFFICYSFQLICQYKKLGRVSQRRSSSIGTYPVHLTLQGKTDVILGNRNDEELLYVADFRDYQVTSIDEVFLANSDVAVLAYEKLRLHVNLERAVMAMKFSNQWYGTQFHPEAQAADLAVYFKNPAKEAEIIKKKGVDKYKEMLRFIETPDGVKKSNRVIPIFIEYALSQLSLN